MSQHLVDTGRRVSTPPGEERHQDPHTKGSGEQSVQRQNGFGNGHAAGAETGAPEVAATGSTGDVTLGALEALSSALDEIGSDQRQLAKRLEELHRQRSSGRSWQEILSEEDPPGTMQLVSRILACLAKASGTLRKELVDSLRREGVSIPAIARLFGVTHQRVSNLLRRQAE
jgi:hypothetical protein